MKIKKKIPKALIELELELKRAIELTEAAANNCTIPSIKFMHIKAIQKYSKKLETCQKKLEKYR